MKESTGATVFRILAAIMSVFLIGIASGMIIVRYTVFRPDFWISIIKEGNFIKEAFIETIEIPEEMEQILDDPDEFIDEFVDIAIDEIGEVFISGDDKVDREVMDELFNSHYKNLDRLEGIGAVDIEQSQQEMYDNFDNSLHEVYEALEDAGYYKALKTIDNKLTYPAAIMIGICLVAYVILIPLHRNKAKVLTSFGIVVTVSEGLLLLGTLAMTGLVRAIIAQTDFSSDEPGLEEFVTTFLGRLAVKINLTVAALFVLGIILIVLGSILSKNYKKTHEDEDRYAPSPVPNQNYNYNNYNNYNNYDNFNYYGGAQAPNQGQGQGASGSYSNLDDMYDE